MVMKVLNSGNVKFLLLNIKQSSLKLVKFTGLNYKEMNRLLFFMIIFLAFISKGNAQKTYPCEIEIDKKAQKLFDKARKANEKGEKAEATKYYKQAIEIQEEWAAPYYHLGMQIVRKIERNEGDLNKLYQQAIEYFEKSTQLCPEYNLTAYLHLGKIYYTIGSYEKAVVVLEKFIEDPDKIKPEQHDEAETYLEYSQLYDKLYNNPVPFDPQPLKGVSSDDDEYLATISPDNDYLLFTRRKLEAVRDIHRGTTKNEFKEIFTITQRQKDGQFDYGNPMPDPFNKSKNEGSPTITVDNRYLVFTKCMDVIVSNNLTYYNCDLYYSEFIDGEWTPIASLGRNINREDTWESQASISPDGQTLFFVSDRPGGNGGYDIYFSTRDVNGNWRLAENAGKIINTDQNEKTPFLHSDSKTLYFSSTGHRGLGGYDIFMSRVSNEGRWKKPVNIGYPINSENDDVGLFVNTFGDKAYIASNRFSKNWDICTFDLYEEVQPDKVLLVKGQVDFDKENAADIEMQLENVDNKKIQNINIDKSTGKYAFIITDIDNDYVLSARQEGSVYDLKYIAPKAVMSEGKQELTEMNVKLEAIEEGKSYKINDIYFATNSSELTQMSRDVIEILIDFMNDNPSIVIQIQGHTDNIGQRKDNLVLSDNRAKEVYNYLIERHIDSSRLTYKGYADTQPVASNDTEEGRALNRRTVFVILKK